MTRSARGVAPRYPIPLHRWAAMLGQPCPDPLDVPEPVARLYELLARLGAGASEATWQADTSPPRGIPCRFCERDAAHAVTWWGGFLAACDEHVDLAEHLARRLNVIATGREHGS